MADLVEGFYSIPFVYRLLGVCLVLAGVALVERRLRPGRAVRGLEYLFWLASALAAGLFGALVDLATSRLSPDYFVLGKGLSEASVGPAMALGFEAGVAAGAVVGGLLLWANNPRAGRGQLGHRRLALELGWPAGLALALAPACGLAGGCAVGWLPADWTAVLGPTAGRFATVWGAHAGVYLGALVGTAIAVIRVRRARAPEACH